MAGQPQSLSDFNAKRFIESFKFSEESARASLISERKFGIADSICTLRFGQGSPHHALINSAFIPLNREDNGLHFEIVVFEDEEFWKSEICLAFRQILSIRSFTLDQDEDRYEIIHHRYEEMIFLFDKELSKISILLGPERSRDISWFVTPFRIAVDLIAQQIGATAVHGSVVVNSGAGFLLNGASGSGKSTMAALALANGYRVLADDVVVVKGDRLYAVYRHAKVEKELANQVLGSEIAETLPINSQGKTIFDLVNSAELFCDQAKLKALIFPKVVGEIASHRVSSAESLRLLAPNTMREVMGGTNRTLSLLANISRRVPAYSLSLGEDSNSGYQELAKIIEGESSVDARA